MLIKRVGKKECTLYNKLYFFYKVGGVKLYGVSFDFLLFEMELNFYKFSFQNIPATQVKYWKLPPKMKRIFCKTTRQHKKFRKRSRNSIVIWKKSIQKSKLNTVHAKEISLSLCILKPIKCSHQQWPKIVSISMILIWESLCSPNIH